MLDRPLSKFGLYCATDKLSLRLGQGQIDGLGLDAQLIVRIGQGPPRKIALGSTDQATGIGAILQRSLGADFGG
jgi:hypothetical protein